MTDTNWIEAEIKDMEARGAEIPEPALVVMRTALRDTLPKDMTAAEIGRLAEELLSAMRPPEAPHAN
jgi:hypothetical protein